jgi:hypothetical protein
MAVFYWINQGRLGNLLFQYAAIMRHTTPDDRVYSFHHDVIDLLDIDRRFKVIPGTGMLARRINFRINRLARAAVRYKWVGSVEPDSQLMFDTYRSETENVVRVEGTLKGHFILEGFFQVGRALDVPLRINPELIAVAGRRLLAATRTNTTVAVHIRLTDYSTWTVLGIPGTIVPTVWYRDRMNELRRRLESPTFVVFSDDIPQVKQLGLGEEVVYFQGNSSLEDFVAMSLCDHAIISPSSFAWWASCVFQRTDKIVMAPQYWAGFKSRTWYPPTIMTEGIEYYPVA